MVITMICRCEQWQARIRAALNVDSNSTLHTIEGSDGRGECFLQYYLVNFGQETCFGERIPDHVEHRESCQKIGRHHGVSVAEFVNLVPETARVLVLPYRA